MSFIWRTDAQSTQAPPALSSKGLLIVRTCISSVFGLGLSYGVLVFTTFSRYGETMERAWKRKINEWVQEKMLLRGHASYEPQIYEPRSAPTGQYPHLPELYSQSLPPRASNASDTMPPFSVAQSNTDHGKNPASSLSEKADRRKRFNPPTYFPGPSGHWDDSHLKTSHGHPSEVKLPLEAPSIQSIFMFLLYPGYPLWPN